jgi:hypothetical protein
VAPKLPFMQIRRLRHQMGGYGIVGQVINIPVDVNNMVTTLPRQLDDDYSFNVHLKINLIHKSTYLQYISQFNTVFNVNLRNQGSPITFLPEGCLHKVRTLVRTVSGVYLLLWYSNRIIKSIVCCSTVPLSRSWQKIENHCFIYILFVDSFSYIENP